MSKFLLKTQSWHFQYVIPQLNDAKLHNHVKKYKKYLYFLHFMLLNSRLQHKKKFQMKGSKHALAVIHASNFLMNPILFVARICQYTDYAKDWWQRTHGWLPSRVICFPSLQHTVQLWNSTSIPCNGYCQLLPQYKVAAARSWLLTSIQFMC
jgi:hypothetical protein